MTKKLISILLAVLMLMTYVTPVMALPLDLNPLEDVVEGSVSEAVEEPAEPVEEPAEPNAEINATMPAPKAITKNKVDQMYIGVLASTKNVPSGVRLLNNKGILASNVKYTIGEIEGDETKGYTTTVTFHFASGDDFEGLASEKLNNTPAFKDAGDQGNWKYYFTESHPADQVLTLYWVVSKSLATGNYVGNWKIKKSAGGYTTDLTTSVGAYVQADFRLESELPKSYTVTYTDGVEDEEVFADQVYTVGEGEATPAFNGTPARAGYDFIGWEPAVAETVTADATYTAQWKVQGNAVARLESTGAEYDTLAKALAAAKTEMKNGPQTVTLLKDVNESVSVDWYALGSSYDYDLTIDLNGKTVTGKKGSVFTFTRTGRSDVGKMYITFNDSVGTGVVTGGNATKANTVDKKGYGGAINLNSAVGGAKLVINGGKFTGNSAEEKGGAIYAGFANGKTDTQRTVEVVLAGGEITGNNASEGGGVAVWNNISLLTQTGCKVYGNTASKQGDDIVYRASYGSASSPAKMSLAENAWFVDKANARYNTGTRVPFTKWASYTEKGNASEIGLKFVEPTYYTVTYTDGVNEDAFENQETRVAEGSATPAFNGTPERAGYKFLGWEPAVAETVTADVTYTAQWQALDKYTLTLSGNGGKLTTGAPASNVTGKYFEEANVNLSTAMNGKRFAKNLSSDYTTNYRQIGWNTKADGTGTHYAMNATFVMPAYDVTLYAEWESYEWIHWNVQMGEGGDHINYSVNNKTFEVQSFKAYTGNQGNQYGKVPAMYYTPVTAVAKVGYRFIGWYDVEKDVCISTNESLFVQDFRDLRKLNGLSESGAVLEARFEPKKPGNVHVVVYKASDLSKPVVSKTVSGLWDGDVFTPDIADYYSSANGYEFVGWFNDGNFNQYKAGKSYTEATEFTVTGNWQNVIAVVTDYEKVIVKAVYDGDKENAKTVYTGLALRGSNVIEFLEANAGVSDVYGYELDKWYNWDWYGHKVAENATVNGWTNVYVTYTRNVFTVTYTDGVNGAAFADRSYEVKYGEATPAFDGSLEDYTGWVFNGWNPKVADKVTGDVTYTAKWKTKGANTVIYYGNEGELSNGNTFWSEYTNAQTKVLSSNTGYYEFARTGWHFTGWNTKADGTGESYAAGATYTFTAAHNLETVELYAQWERNTYTVTYDDGVNGAAFTSESHTAKYEDATPAFEGSFDNYIGWVFNGWTPAVADKVTGDVTYTAKWKMKGANTLYYHGNGGATEGKFSSDTYSSYTNAASITVKGNGTTGFVRDEYKFIGWNTKADGTGTAYPVGSTYNFEYAHNLEEGHLYAQWEHIACDKHLEEVKVITAPTCTEDGLKLCRCTVCGKEVEVVIPALGHDHSGKWTWNREDHWKKCTRCGEILDLHEHTYGEWKSIDTDREQRSCTVCGFTQYAQIIHIGGKPTTKPTDEENPNTGAEVR